MGNFYTNIALRGPNQEEILSYLRAQRRTAFVAPTRNKVTVVYDQEYDEQAVDILTNLTEELSRKFCCPALAALVHDDEILWLKLFDDGKQVMSYDSSFFFSGGAYKLCSAFGVAAATPLVLVALNLTHWVFIFEHLRHALLAKLLKLPRWVIASGYNYIDRGERPIDLQLADVKHTRRAE